MADEQDVFISGISGSIQQWSTEATASKIEGTLKQISAQNASIIGLLNAVKSGGSLSTKQVAKMGAELRANNRTEVKGQKAESIKSNRTQSWFGKMTGKLGILASGQGKQTDIILQNARAERNEAAKLNALMKAGLSREDATKTVEGDKKKFNIEKAAAATAGLLGVIAMVQEATKVGFENRFDMAHELRTSGLMDGINGMNEGFIGIAKTVSETGFTFGMAAEFTKDFAKTVGILGVKSTLKFVNSMARGDGGLMQKFGMEFGEIISMSGEYLDTLRISGQLQGRSDQQLRQGMDSFMSNVQATANVLKISMEEAARLMKSSLSDVEKGLLLTLPRAMQDSVRGAMAFAGGVDNPLTELLSARLGAGSQGMFQLTSSFQDTSQTALGMEMIKFVNQAASQLETGGDAQFQSFMATAMPEFVSSEIQRYQGAGARGLAISQPEILTMLAQLNQLAQNMFEVGQGISGGGREDNAMIRYRDQQLEGVVLGEGAMNSAMAGYITNLEKLTESNRATAITVANTITANANLIDMSNNLATTFDRGENLFTRAVFKFADVVGTIVTLGNNDNEDFMQLQDFTSGSISEGYTQNTQSFRNKDTISLSARQFKEASEKMLISIQSQAADKSLNSKTLEQMAFNYALLTDTLIGTKGGTDEGNEEIKALSIKTLAGMNTLVQTLNGNK